MVGDEEVTQLATDQRPIDGLKFAGQPSVTSCPKSRIPRTPWKSSPPPAPEDIAVMWFHVELPDEIGIVHDYGWRRREM